MVEFIIITVSLFIYIIVGSYVVICLIDVPVSVIEDFGHILAIIFPLIILYILIIKLIIKPIIKIIKMFIEFEKMKKMKYKNLSQKQLRVEKLKRLNKKFKFF